MATILKPKVWKSIYYNFLLYFNVNHLISSKKLFFIFNQCKVYSFFLTNGNFFKFNCFNKGITFKKRVILPFFYFFKNFSRSYYISDFQRVLFFSPLYFKHLRLKSFFFLFFFYFYNNKPMTNVFKKIIRRPAVIFKKVSSIFLKHNFYKLISFSKSYNQFLEIYNR